MSLKVDLKQAIYALSDALDLIGIDDVAHGKRVGIMAAECAKTLGLSAEEVAFVFDLGLLHDIGVSSTQTHKHLVEEFDWIGSQEHARIGHDLLADFAPLANMALPIRYHHTRWDKLQTLAIDEQVALQANLTLLVDRVDALTAPYYASNSVLEHIQPIRDTIAQHAGTYFAQTLIDAFMETSRKEAFWLLLEPRAIQNYLRDQYSRGETCLASYPELKQLAVIFSRIVDAKSPFTAEHSLGVSRLARYIAETMNLDADNCQKIEIAGLLHDLGKLRIPDEVLEKPAKLDLKERLIINTHTFETFQILHGISGFEDVACWAAYHHEEPDGTGYPFHVTAEQMPLEAKILRVADIFQAMVQNRPYRKGLQEDEVIAFMQELDARGRIDSQIVNVVVAHIQGAMQAARGA